MANGLNIAFWARAVLLGMAAVTAGAANVSAAAAPAKLVPIVMLGDSGTPANMIGHCYGAEVFREAVVLAAHNGLGLMVRDQGAGDAVEPAGLTGARVLNLREKMVPAGHYVALRLEMLEHGKSRVIWHERVVYDDLAPWKQVPFLTASAARLMGSIRQALIVAHFPDMRPKAKPAVFSSNIGQRLNTMNFVEQWLVLRAIDRRLRSHRMSAQSLRLLARGNANMALLTDQLFTSYRDVYKARAMLYLAMLKAKFGQDKGLAWTQAYVEALIGLPLEAQKALARGKRLDKGVAARRPWVKAIAAYTRYRAMTLARISRGDGPSAGLAAVLAAMTLNGGYDRSMRQGIIVNALNGSDHDSLCLVELLQNGMGVDAGDLVNGKTNAMLEYALATRLTAMRHLPSQIHKIISGLTLLGPGQQTYNLPEQLHGLIAALAAAGNPKMDRGFPSWQSVGAIAESTAVFNCGVWLYR